MGNNADEERKVHLDCRNASNPYHECSDYCFKITAAAKKRMNQTDTGMVIRTSLVQKALKERKEKLMAQARASLGITSPPANPDLMDTNDLLVLDSSTGITSTASHKHGEPFASSSKDKPKRCKSKDSLCGEASKKVREDKQPDPTELESALQQLEIQRKFVDDQRSEVRAQSGESPREFSGDRIVPNWNISSQSSVVKTRAGEDSFELYRACLLPMDQITLAPMPPCKLEEIAAHDLMRVAAVTHQLTLQCTMWRRERMELLEKVAQLEREKHEVESRVRAEYEQRVIELERLVFEFKDWTEKAEKALLKSNTELKRLEQKCTDSFNAGRAAGGREFAESEEYRAALREARLSGAKDFKNSATFDLILATKAAEYEVIGFIKCQSQILKLGGFKPGFNLGLLDSAKDGNLESPTVDDDDASETDDPEFGFLAEETGVNPLK